MRFHLYLLSLLLLVLAFSATTGCGGPSGTPEVAPRTESEIEAYKKQVYAAEEEEQGELEAEAEEGEEGDE